MSYQPPANEQERIARRLNRARAALEAVERGEGPHWLPNAVQMLTEGKHGLDISAELGIPSSTLYQGLNDPVGEKARKRKKGYAGVCEDCGGPTSGSRSGRDRVPDRCQSCSRERQTRDRKWTREAIIRAMRDWYERYGLKPSSSDWNPGAADYDQRHMGGDFPVPGTVVAAFGTWNAGLEAAGFEVRWTSPGPNSLSAEELAKTVALAESGVPRQTIAAGFGISPSAVSQRLIRAQRGSYMPSPLTVDKIIDREIAKWVEKKEQAEQTKRQAEVEVARLSAAREALQVAA